MVDTSGVPLPYYDCHLQCPPWFGTGESMYIKSGYIYE